MRHETPWRKYVVEAFVIVGSILLAFVIDAWWDRTQARRTEIELLSTIYEELAVSKNELVTQIRLHGDLFDYSTELLAFGLSSEVNTPPSELAAAWPLYLYNSTALDTGALDGALSSGELETITNRKLRSRLGAWPTAVREFIEEETAGRDFVYSNLSVVGRYFRSPQHFRIQESGTIDEAAILFLKSLEGQNLVSVRLKIERDAFNDAETLLSLLEELLALIDLALGSEAT